jgi:photosystem II stability/assembly factor-like uncharacterized protein
VQSSGASQSLRSVYFIDADTGYAVGTSGRLIKTTDGGTTWNILWSTTSLDLNAVYFPSAETGYMVGVSGQIFKTSQ